MQIILSNRIIKVEIILQNSLQSDTIPYYTIRQLFFMQFFSNRISLKKQIKQLKDKRNLPLPFIMSTHKHSIQFGKYMGIQIQKENKNKYAAQMSKTSKMSKININKNRANIINEVIQKSFLFESSDYYIKRILIQDGWKLCTSAISNVKLKWITLPKNQHFNNIKQTQFVNHFKDSYKLTTKLGLYKLISSPNYSHSHQNGSNYLDYYPRSYDLSTEYDCFQNDFMQTSIFNLMKKIMIHIELMNNQLYQKIKKVVNLEKIQENKLFSILLQKIQNKQIFIEQTRKNKEKCQKKRSNHADTTDTSININGLVFINLLFYCISKFSLNNQTFNCDKELLISYSKRNPPYVSVQEHFHNDVRNIKYLSKKGLVLFFQLYKLCLKKCKWFLNDGLNNIWIVKANQGSRGRNIFLIDSLESANVHNNSNRIIQKYIENVWICDQIFCEDVNKYPFLNKIMKKKFDIRLWVLVKSFSPLVAYVYDQGYLRISAQKYQLQTLQSLKTHLTNFKVNYANQSTANKQQSYVILSDFLNFLQEQQYTQKGKILQEIKQKIKSILYSASISYREQQSQISSFQLYGFDVILDNQLKPWILQCNMSPACNQRGQLKKLTQDMGRGLLHIVGLVQSQPFLWKNLIYQRRSNIQRSQAILISESKQNKIMKSTSSSKFKKNMLHKINYTQLSMANSSQGFYSNFQSTFLFAKQGDQNLKLQIIGSKFCKNKNRTHENLSYIYEKVVFLQKFYRKRFNAKPKKTIFEQSSSQVQYQSQLSLPIGRCLKIIQKLSLFLKIHKKYWLKKLKRNLKKTDQ